MYEPLERDNWIKFYILDTETLELERLSVAQYRDWGFKIYTNRASCRNLELLTYNPDGHHVEFDTPLESKSFWFHVFKSAFGTKLHELAYNTADEALSAIRDLAHFSNYAVTTDTNGVKLYYNPKTKDLEYAQ